MSSHHHPVEWDASRRAQPRLRRAVRAPHRERWAAHPGLVALLSKDPTDENRSKGEISRNKIKAAWDLWAFGLTLLDWLGIDRSDGEIGPDAFYHRLEPYVRKYYMLLVARLLTDSLQTWLSKKVGLSAEFLKEFAVSSAGELVDCLQRLEGIDSPIDHIEELAEQSSGSILAGPGLHIPTTPALDSVLDHRLYRRLNSITQLGLVSQVYPGAKHTRREHSLGTYANVARYLRALYDDTYSPLFRQILTEEDCRAVLLAALLHDLGQFPLAHDLEEIDKGVFSHADVTHAMLRGEWDRKRAGSRPVRFGSLASIFSQWRVRPERVRRQAHLAETNCSGRCLAGQSMRTSSTICCAMPCTPEFPIR